jgi:hypothetical protein
MGEQTVTVTLTVKEFSAISGVVCTFALLHPGHETAQKALAGRESMCAQVGIDPRPGMDAARESLDYPTPTRVQRWLRR